MIIVAGNYRLDSLGWIALEELQEEAADGSFGNYGTALPTDCHLVRCVYVCVRCRADGPAGGTRMDST